MRRRARGEMGGGFRGRTSESSVFAIIRMSWAVDATKRITATSMSSSLFSSRIFESFECRNEGYLVRDRQNEFHVHLPVSKQHPACLHAANWSLAATWNRHHHRTCPFWSKCVPLHAILQILRTTLPIVRILNLSRFIWNF